jgi:hypothetical protein
LEASVEYSALFNEVELTSPRNFVRSKVTTSSVFTSFNICKITFPKLKNFSGASYPAPLKFTVLKELAHLED